MDDTTAVIAADAADRERIDTVAPGVTYRCLYRPRGPWLVHIVSVDLHADSYALESVRAKDARIGRERVSSMMQRQSKAPVASINGDFFDLQTGEIENNSVVRGDWVKGVVATDSPHDQFVNAHTQFGVDARGRPLIGRLVLVGRVASGRRTERLVGINHRPPRTEGLVLFTPWYGSRTLGDSIVSATGPRERVPDATPPAARPDTSQARVAPTPAQLRADSAREASLRIARASLELTIQFTGRRGDTLFYRALELHPLGGNHQIPARGAVLSAAGDSAIAFLRGVATRRGVIRVVAALNEGTGAPRTVVGGWPRLVRDGQSVALLADSLEGTFPRFSAARHPRSAVAVTRDSSTLMLVVVDGRRPWSVGMSLGELADQLLALGAYQAMNFDGGGSSTLWVDGSVVNFPSDPKGERAVGNALVVARRR